MHLVFFAFLVNRQKDRAPFARHTKAPHWEDVIKAGQYYYRRGID